MSRETPCDREIARPLDKPGTLGPGPEHDSDARVLTAEELAALTTAAPSRDSPLPWESIDGDPAIVLDADRDVPVSEGVYMSADAAYIAAACTALPRLLATVTARDAEIATLHRALRDEYGPGEPCGDHSCVVAPARGMSTNGGCRCSRGVLRRAVRAARAEVAALRERLALVEARSEVPALREPIAEEPPPAPRPVLTRLQERVLRTMGAEPGRLWWCSSIVREWRPERVAPVVVASPLRALRTAGLVRIVLGNEHALTPAGQAEAARLRAEVSP